MIDWLANPFLPFAFPFMQNAFVIGLLVAIPMGFLSCFLVLKGWSLMGDAMSHAVLPGIVIAYILNIPLVIGAFAAGMFCALATGYLKENSRIKEDTVMGVVFSGMFGLGLILYLNIESDIHLDHILFGNMLGVNWTDIGWASAIASVTLLFILLQWKDLLLHTFDGQHARAIGLPVRFLHYGLLAILSLSIVGALKAVGIILAIAVLIAPGATAFLLTRRFGPMLILSGSAAGLATLLGIYVSFFIDSAPAPTIVLVMTGFFILAWLRTLLRQRMVSVAGK